MKYNDKILFLLEKKNITHAEFMRGARIASQSAQDLKDGKIKNPQKETKEKVAAFFGLTIPQIFDEETDLPGAFEKPLHEPEKNWDEIFPANALHDPRAYDVSGMQQPIPYLWARIQKLQRENREMEILFSSIRNEFPEVDDAIKKIHEHIAPPDSSETIKYGNLRSLVEKIDETGKHIITRRGHTLK